MYTNLMCATGFKHKANERQSIYFLYNRPGKGTDLKGNRPNKVTDPIRLQTR